MLEKAVQLVKDNRLVQFGLVLVLGIAIGALFYPTKNIEERVKKEYEEKLVQQASEHKLVEKELQDKYDKSVQEKSQLQVETTRQIASLNIQIRELQTRTREKYYKIVKPDGTIEERRFTDSEVNESTQVITQVREEFNQKISEIKESYEKVHRERVTKIKEEFDKKEATYKSVIAKMESEKKVEINPKKYGLELGYLSNKDYYGHVNVDVFGPVFLGVHTQTNLTNDHAVGAGIGIRF